LSVREALHEMNVNETQLMDIIELMQQAGYSIHVPNNNELKSVDDLCKKLEQKDEIKSKQEMSRSFEGILVGKFDNFLAVNSFN
jgi:hypothetical protein